MEQQILSLDSRYSAYRAPNVPGFKTLYIRRRSQLLKNFKTQIDPTIRKQYLKTRNLLLSQKYGVNLDSNSRKSLSYRSGSQQTLESVTSPSGHVRYSSQSSLRHHAASTSNEYLTPNGLVPTWAAEATRAMTGSTSLAENYAFCGVYHIFDVHKAVVTSVQFAHDDLTRLASSSMDGSLAVHKVLPEPETSFVLKHPKGVTGFCWSYSNDLIMSCSEDGYARLFNSTNGACVRAVHGIQSGVAVLTGIFHPVNNNMIVTGSSKGHVEVTNCSTGIKPRGAASKVNAPVLSLCFDNDGQVLWAGDERGYITSLFYNSENNRLSKGKRFSVSGSNPVTCISMRQWISREAREPSLLVNCSDNALFLFRIVGPSNSAILLRRTFPIAHASPNSRIRSCFCPIMSFRQGACVVTGSEDGSVYFFNAERTNKACINKLQGHSAPVIDVSFNYDESMLASCDSQGQVIVWKKEP